MKLQFAVRKYLFWKSILHLEIHIQLENLVENILYEISLETFVQEL